MHNSPFQNTPLAIGLSHAIEFHHLGSKIPDLIVDRLTREISISSSFTKNILTDNLYNPALSVGQIAFDLWKSGELSLITLAGSIASLAEQADTKIRQATLPKSISDTLTAYA